MADANDDWKRQQAAWEADDSPDSEHGEANFFNHCGGRAVAILIALIGVPVATALLIFS